MIDYVSARLAQQGSPVHGLIAHSLGAAAAAYSAARRLPIARLVLIAPAAQPPAYTRMFAHVFGISEQTRSGMQRRIEAREGMLMAHFNASASGAGIRVPTLVVHDRNDTVNTFADGEAYVAAIEGASLHETQTLGHRGLLKDPGVVARVAQFIGSDGA